MSKHWELQPRGSSFFWHMLWFDWSACEPWRCHFGMILTTAHFSTFQYNVMKLQGIHETDSSHCLFCLLTKGALQTTNNVISCMLLCISFIAMFFLMLHHTWEGFQHVLCMYCRSRYTVFKVWFTCLLSFCLTLSDLLFVDVCLQNKILVCAHLPL